MNIISLSNDQAVFDPASPVRRRLEAFAETVAAYHVIVYTNRRTPREPIAAGRLFIHPTASRSKLWYFHDCGRIAAAILAQARSADWVVTTQDPFELGLAGLWLKYRHHVPLECQIHIDFYNPYFRRESWRQWLQSRLAPFVIRRADTVRAVSRRIATYVEHQLGLSPERIINLPVWTDVSRYTTAPASGILRERYPQFSTIIIMPCRLVKQKNVPLAIRAMATLATNQPRLGLVIIGRGPEAESLHALAGDASNVVFEPWTTDLGAYYRSADLFLLTSNYEGWGLTVVEAAASGTPIVMTDVGCAGEFVHDGESAVIIPPGDQEALTEALLALLNDSARRDRLATAAQKHVASLPPLPEYLIRLRAGWETGHRIALSS